MSAFETAPSSNDILWNESEEELETAGIEVRQYSVAEAEYEAAGAEDEESSAEEAVETLGNVPTKKQSTVLEGEEKYPSFSLAVG